MKFAGYAMPSYRTEFGLTQGEFLRATLEHLVEAERLGFDSIWVNEHHFHQYGGRLDFGIGRGFVAHDYEVLGVDYADAQQRLIEALAVILRAWTVAPFSHHGTYFTDVEVWPRPQQQPHPPI